MNNRTDQQLLREYAGQRSEPAFSELTRRHVDLVYSAAMRMTRDTHLAEDVTQKVFVALAQNAGKLTGHPVLAGWLHCTARNIAANAVRADARRRLREQEAATMNEMSSTNPEASWEQIAPELDLALSELGEADRDALLLRYFQRKSAQEMAPILGLSAASAQKRVNRAVERLRAHFTKRNVKIGAGGLALLISANAVQAAPSGLVGSVASSAVLAGVAVPVSTAIATAKLIAMTTLQKTIVVGAIAVTACAGIYEANEARQLRQQVQSLEQQQNPLASQLDELRQQLAKAGKNNAALVDELARAKSNNLELLKLRKEATAQMQSKANNPADSAAKAWAARASRLKQRSAATPAANIPEMRFLTEDDWLAAAKRPLDTDDDFRRAMALLRSSAESEFVEGTLKPALNKFEAANKNQFPTDLSQLQAYFDSPVEDAILQRWEIVPGSVVPNVGVGDTIITQKTPVDEVLDQRYVLGVYGNGGTDWLSGASISDQMEAVYKSFYAANGTDFTNISQLLPYATTPAQKAFIQQRLAQMALRK